MSDLYSEAVETARTVDLTGEQADWQIFDGLDLIGLLGVVAEARERKRHADLIRAAAKARATDLLGAGNAVTDGRTLYRVTPKTERTVKDPVELIQWLGPQDAAKVLNLSQAVGIEAFRGLCEARGLDAKELEAHFFKVSFGDYELSEIPLENKHAPKYAASMVPGEIRRKP